MRASERGFALAYGLWLFGVFAYFVPAATWNPVSHFDLTRAIVEQRTLSIDAYVDNTGDRALSGGHWYTEKAPMPSFFAVPAYAVVHASQTLRGAHPEYEVFSKRDVPAERVVVNAAFQQGLYVCSLSTAGAGTALLGVVLFFVLRRRFSPDAALVGSASVVLGTPILPYATSFYGHSLAAALLGVALALLLRKPGQEPSRRNTALAGACLVLASGCEYLAAIPGLVIFSFWVASLPRQSTLRGIVGVVAGGLVPALVIAWYHWTCFGAPWRTGYAFVVRPEFMRGHASGLMGLHFPTLEGLGGLLFGPRRGLLLLAPFTALAIVFGIMHAFRSGDVASRAGLFAFAALLLANAGYYMWWGGAAAGPRHVVPALAFLSFGAARAWDSRARWVVSALVLISVLNLLALTAVGLEAPDRGNVLVDYVYRRLAHGEIASLSGASNMGLRLGLVRGATLGPILVWLLLGGRFLARVLPLTDAASDSAAE